MKQLKEAKIEDLCASYITLACVTERDLFIIFVLFGFPAFVVCSSLINKNIKDVFLYVYPALESGGETTT